MGSIKEKLREIKDREPKRLETLLTALIIVLVGTLGFGIGKISQIEAETESIRIEQVPIFQNTNAATAVSAVSQTDSVATQSQGAVVGSKNSDKYHYPWCSGAKRISDANKIFFNSIEEARAAGYKPAGNCPGLE